MEVPWPIYRLMHVDGGPFRRFETWFFGYWLTLTDRVLYGLGGVAVAAYFTALIAGITCALVL